MRLVDSSLTCVSTPVQYYQWVKKSTPKHDRVSAKEHCGLGLVPRSKERKLGERLQIYSFSVEMTTLHHQIKGAMSRYSVIFCTFLRDQKMAAAHASVADISSVSRANSFTTQAVSSKCHFPRAIVVFRGLPLWPPLFSPTQYGCRKSPIIVTLPL